MRATVLRLCVILKNWNGYWIILPFLPASAPEITPSSHSPYMIGANGSVRGKKEFEPSSLAAESEPLLGPHLEDY